MHGSTYLIHRSAVCRAYDVPWQDYTLRCVAAMNHHGAKTRAPRRARRSMQRVHPCNLQTFQARAETIPGQAIELPSLTQSGSVSTRAQDCKTKRAATVAERDDG
jgi:hypothetical protein